MEQQIASVQANLDIIWIMVTAALVMFMQAGFTALESGMTQAKNTINVAAKNMIDFIVAVLVFWLLGYGLMFGSDVSGMFGSDNFAIGGDAKAMDYASFVFQATFAGTAATIVSGAVAERIRFVAYVIISILVTAIVYPISGHWIWGSGGWLADLQMVDFAGSTVVHSLGGWIGLAGAIVLGPRLGRFNEDGTPNRIPGHSLVLAVIGTLILWFGWFGFNGGSTLEGTDAVAKIIANTMIAAAAGGMSSFLLSLFLTGGEVHIEKLLNGVIGGLVGITAGCAVADPIGSFLIGLTSGIVVYGSEWFLINILKVDDPVGAVPAHGFGGAWGTLSLALFAPVDALPLADRWAQLSVQFTGVISVFAWGFGMGLLLFWMVKVTGFLRVTPDGERAGLNVHEHGASSGLLDAMNTMHQIATAHQGGNGDLTRRIAVEVGTEAGMMAETFNRFIDGYEQTIARMKLNMGTLRSASDELADVSHHMSGSAEEQGNRVAEISTAIRQMSASFGEVVQMTNKAATLAQAAQQRSSEGEMVVNETIDLIEGLAREVDNNAQVISRLNEDSETINSIVDTIRGISEQTNLLALNAAIEAARAGEHGRGFAVVADEVRTLSMKTQEATNEIRGMIERLQDNTGSAVVAMENSKTITDETVAKAKRSGEALQAITQDVQEISDMNTQIATAAEQQSVVTDEIKLNMDAINDTVVLTSGNAVKTSQASERLTQITEEIHHLVEHFSVSSEQTLIGDFQRVA